MARHSTSDVRPAAFAGTWYPADPDRLRAEVDACLAAVDAVPAGSLKGLIAPHAGLRYSGPVAAWSYRMLADRPVDVIVLIGPSHYESFEGAAADDSSGYETPIGWVPVAQADARRLADASPLICVDRRVHRGEHAIEMQMPFLRRVAPGVPVVPVLMGDQRSDAVEGVARAVVDVFADRVAVLVASTDLSHFCSANDAAKLGVPVMTSVERVDADGLMSELERYPEHERGRFVACGGGAAAVVLRAAAALGARDGRVLRYGDSGDVSGDHDRVVAYLAGAIGEFGSAGITGQADAGASC